MLENLPSALVISRRCLTVVAVQVLLGSSIVSGCTGSKVAESEPNEHLSPDVTDTSDGTTADSPDTSYACEVGHQQLDLGKTKTGVDGLSPPIDFQVPQCARSFVITLSGDDALHYILAELSPAGSLSLVPKAWLQVSGSPMACMTPCPNRIAAQMAQASFLFPNTPLADVTSGSHRMRVFAFKRKATPSASHKPMAAEVAIRVDVVLGPDDGKELSLPLNLCLTGAAGITADNAPAHPRVQAALATFNTLLAPAGIVAAPVRYFEVDSSHRFINSIEGPKSDLSRLFGAGSGLPAGLNVFFVEQIKLHSGGFPGSDLLYGLSGGIPGPPRQVGCDRCGVAVSVTNPPGQADLLGILMAHETAHYLGLFHSTEPPPEGGGASIHDNLPDTPKDAGDNLMFYSVTDQSASLTAQQSVTLRASPWLKAQSP